MGSNPTERTFFLPVAVMRRDSAALPTPPPRDTTFLLSGLQNRGVGKRARCAFFSRNICAVHRAPLRSRCAGGKRYARTWSCSAACGLLAEASFTSRARRPSNRTLRHAPAAADAEFILISLSLYFTSHLLLLPDVVSKLAPRGPFEFVIVSGWCPV